MINTCPGCGKRFPPEVVADCAGVPRCDVCGGVIRPGILLFGEVPDMRLILEAIREINRADLLHHRRHLPEGQQRAAPARPLPRPYGHNKRRAHALRRARGARHTRARRACLRAHTCRTCERGKGLLWQRLKYMVTSGFLGAGKTTSMLALAREINARWGKAAILANDLGAGNIVDADYTATSEVLTTSIAGNCICYQHENLVDKLRQLVAAGATVIFSDIPGCGIGALDHVYLQIAEKEADEFDLLPFTCIE